MGSAITKNLELKFIVVLVMFIKAIPAVSQSSPANGPWWGQIQCQLHVQQSGYTRDETQTWTLTSSTPTKTSGDINIYSATWTVTGQGGFQREMGTRTSLAQWNINVPPANTSIAMFVRAQDKQFIIRIGHRSAPSYTGISAMRQMAENGVPQQAAKVASVVQEWTLPWIQTKSGGIIEGKFSVPAESLGADLTPIGAAPIAECAYHFSGAVSGTPTAPNGRQAAKGSVGSLARGSSAAASLGSQSPGTSNTPIPDDTTSSGSSNSQTCTLSDIESMYDKVSQSIELMFDKLAKEAQTAKSNMSTPATSGDAQAIQRVNYLDQTVPQLSTVKQGLIQELAKSKQQATEQITKAQTDAERQSICQGTQNAVTQLAATAGSEADALEAGISGAGGGLSGSTPAIDIANLKNSVPAKQPQTPSTPVNATATLAPQVVQFQARGQDFAVGNNPAGIAFDGANIWVTNGGTVTKFRTTDGVKLGTFSAGFGAQGIAFDGANIWVINVGAKTVSKIRASDGVNVGNFTPCPPGEQPGGGIIFANTYIWISCPTSLVRLRPSDGVNLGMFTGGGGRLRAFDGTNILATAYHSPRVMQRRTSDGSLGYLDSITYRPQFDNPNAPDYWDNDALPYNSEAEGIVFDGANIWVTVHTVNDKNFVCKRRASDGTWLGEFPVGHQPIGVVFDGANIWVANSLDNTLTKLRASDGTNLGTFATGVHPTWLVFDGTHIWVTNGGGNTVSRF